MSSHVESWTKYTIPESRTIDDESSRDGKKWRLASNISRKLWPGYQGQFYGRVIESPETVWIITQWSTIESLEKYENSFECALQRGAQAEFSSSPRESHRCEVGQDILTSLTPHLGFVDAYFPSSISDEKKEAINQIKVLRYLAVLNQPSSFRRRPSRCWLSGTHSFQGEDAVVVRFCHYWSSRESELKRQVAKESNGTSQQTIYEDNHYESFLNRLRNAGAIGIHGFHLCAERLYDNYRGSDDDDEDDSDDLFIP